jgi:hypothetical protein
LAAAAGREAPRAAVLVVRNDRLMGWKFCGFGVRDAQPRSVDVGLNEGGVVGVAVATSRPLTTGTNEPHVDAPAFADLPAGDLGVAVPVIVGGRVVAAVYADGGAPDDPHTVPAGWPDAVEILARHAARCLEALTAQKAASSSAPRFWVSGGRPTKPASDVPASPTDVNAPPGVTA